MILHFALCTLHFALPVRPTRRLAASERGGQDKPATPSRPLPRPLLANVDHQRVPDDQPGPAYQQAIGNVEIGPGPVNHGDDKQDPVANLMDDHAIRSDQPGQPEAVVEVSQHSRGDAAQGDGQQETPRGRRSRRATDDRPHGEDRHGPGQVTHDGPIGADAEQGAGIEAGLKAEDALPDPIRRPARRPEAVEDAMLRRQIGRQPDQGDGDEDWIAG